MKLSKKNKERLELFGSIVAMFLIVIFMAYACQANNQRSADAIDLLHKQGKLHEYK